MDRRELLKMIAVLTGGAVIGSEFLLSGCKNPSSENSLLFSEDDIAFLNEVAETILPATQSPGAKAANVGQFMTVAVNDCFEEADQKIFHEGIQKLDDACKAMHHARFMNVRPIDRHQLLVAIDKEAKDYQDQKKDSENNKMPSHYFTLIKQLTLWGYFTSKEGMMQAMRYVPVPGRFDACIDYKKGDKLIVGLMG